MLKLYYFVVALLGKGVILGKNVQLAKDVRVWNYVVIGDDTWIGNGTTIGSFCDIGKEVVIGKNCIISAHVTISNECRLGNNIFIGPNTSLLNDKYPYSGVLAPPVIKDRAIIGGCVIIMPAVTIGKSAVVAAGSVVTKSVEKNFVVKGLPARFIMRRKEYDLKQSRYMNE